MSPHELPDLLDAAAATRWYRRSRHRLSASGAWFLGNEPGAMEPERFSAATVRLLIARPSTYRDVAASITHPLLGQLAAEVPGVFVDYAYLPPPGDYPQFREARVAPWSGVTTKEPARRFHVVAISNSFSQELLNLPALLLHSGVPLAHEARMADPDAPLVVIGGANSSALSLVHGPVGPEGASLVDLSLIGEAEMILPEFLRVIAEARARGAGKRELLDECRRRVAGVYEPARYRHVFRRDPDGVERLAEIRPEGEGTPFPVVRALAPRLDRVTALTRGLVPYDAEAAGASAVQADLGCPAFCTFCREGWEVKPYRERSAETVTRILREAKSHQGLDTISFMSFVINIHSQFYGVLKDALPLFHRVSLKSQRFDILAEDPHMAPFQAALGKTSVTCGVEGISERLRRHMHKNITEEMILGASAALFRCRMRELKLFFIATGLEGDADVREFGRLMESLARLRREADARTRIIVSITPLVAMPNTPSQFRACDPEALEGNLEQQLAPICERAGIELRLSSEGAEPKLSQLLLRADRRWTRPLVRSSLELGFLYYRGIPESVYQAWQRFLADEGIPLAEVLRERRGDEVLPWDDVSCGVTREFLVEQYEKSRRDEEGEYCLNRMTVKGRCFDCGGCPEPFQIKDIVKRPTPVPVPVEEIEAIEAGKRETATLRLLLDRDPSLAPAPKRFFQVASARALLLAFPELVEQYLRPGSVQVPDRESDHAGGLLVADLVFRRGAPLDRAIERLAATGAATRGFRIREARREGTAPVAVDRVLFALGAGPFGMDGTLEPRPRPGWTTGRFEGGRWLAPPRGERKRAGLTLAAWHEREARLLVLADPEVPWERLLRTLTGRTDVSGAEARIEALLQKPGAGDAGRCGSCGARPERPVLGEATPGEDCPACELKAGRRPGPVPIPA
jgi:radical SAM superfamily enzyme YgiQ (UPF0313 family)